MAETSLAPTQPWHPARAWSTRARPWHFTLYFGRGFEDFNSSHCPCPAGTGTQQSPQLCTDSLQPARALASPAQSLDQTLHDHMAGNPSGKSVLVNPVRKNSPKAENSSETPGAVRSSQQDRIGSDRGVPWRLPGALQSACPAATECRGWHLPALSHGLWSSAPGQWHRSPGVNEENLPTRSTGQPRAAQQGGRDGGISAPRGFLQDLLTGLVSAAPPWRHGRNSGCAPDRVGSDSSSAAPALLSWLQLPSSLQGIPVALNP